MVAIDIAAFSLSLWIPVVTSKGWGIPHYQQTSPSAGTIAGNQTIGDHWNTYLHDLRLGEQLAQLF